MNAILGKIVKILLVDGELDVEFEPACLLPERAALPEWLKGKKLTIRRRVKDPREVGAIGDSIVLSANESARYLSPLALEPAVCYGALAGTLSVIYGLPREDKAAEYAASAGGVTVKGNLEKDGDLWRGQIDTASLTGQPLRAPATVTVTVDKCAATCVLLAADMPVHGKVTTPDGPAYRLENDWYAVDISLTAGAGAVSALMEKGRGRDHFEPPKNLTCLRQEGAGHLDRVHLGSAWDWFEKLRDTAVGSAGAACAGGAIRLDLESALDDGQQVRTSVVHTLYHDIPLLTMQRSYHKGKPAASEKKDEPPKETIEEVTPLGFGFRASWIAERHKGSGSRILCADGLRLCVIRHAEPSSFIDSRPWSVSGGWCLVEHPRRRDYMLYLFDTANPPRVATWAGPHTITLEPYWPLRLFAPEQSASLTLGVAAGEMSGASADGAWVACRSIAKGKVCVGVVARLADNAASRDTTITLGGETRTASLTPLFIAGLGTLHMATLEFSSVAENAPLDAIVADIPARPGEDK